MSDEHAASTEILIPYTHTPAAQLQLRVGACKLRIRPGGSAWVTGSYTDPTRSLPYKISQEDNKTKITQEPRLQGITSLGRGVPSFDLSFGTAHPYALTIETGASETDIELGGVPLTQLTLKLGAGKHAVRFLEPNPQQMESLTIGVGASSLELRGLVHANFTKMSLDGGALSCVCDFGGTLQRNATAQLSVGMATLDVTLPPTLAAHVVPEVTLGKISVADGFTTRENGYKTNAALEASSPLLHIHASVALGMFQLQLASS